MLTKNFYRILLGRCAGITLKDAGIVKADGSTMSDTAVITNYWAYGTCFGYKGSSTPSPCMTRVFTAKPSDASGYGGVFFGNGTTPPTLDDKTLSGDVISTITTTASAVSSIDENGNPQITASYTISNTGSEPVTISEVGLFEGLSNWGFVMIERTLLETPVTIAAGGIGQVTYTIKFNYPTT